ncbi:hypothetical protein R6Q59_010028 [Mikania micrantha]
MKNKDLRATNAIICNKGHAKWIDFGSSGIDSKPALDAYDEYDYKPQDQLISTHKFPNGSLRIRLYCF